MATLPVGCGLAYVPPADGATTPDGGGRDAAPPDDVGAPEDGDVPTDANVRDATIEPDAGGPTYDPTRLSLCQAIEPRSVAALSPDGSLVALVGPRSIELADARDGRTRRTIFARTTLDGVLGFTVDGAALVVIEGNEVARYDVTSGARSTTPLGSSNAPSAAAITPTGVVAVVDGGVQEISFAGARRTLAPVPLGPTPQQVVRLPSGDLLLVTTDTLRRIASTDGHEVARAAAPSSDGFAIAGLLGDGSIVVARYRGITIYDASLSLLASFPIVTPLLAATGAHVLVAGDAGGATVLDYAHTGSATSLTPRGSIPIDASAAPASALLAAGSTLAASAPSGAFVVARDADLAVTLRRDALPIDASAGLALLAPHRVVLASNVLDLDTQQVVHDFGAAASRVIGDEHGDVALRQIGSAIEVVDAGLGTRALPFPPGATALALSPDGLAVGALLGGEVQRFDLASGVLARAPVTTTSPMLTLGPGGARVYVRGPAGGVVAVDVPGGASETVLADGFVDVVVASRDGRTLAVDAAPGLLLIDAQAPTTSRPAGPPATAIAFADESRWVFTADGAGLFAQSVDGRVGRRRIATDDAIALLAAAPDGEIVVAGEGTSLHVYCTPESSLHP